MRQNVENGVKINKMRQCPFLGKRKALSDHNYYVHPKYLHECGRIFKTKVKCRKHEERLNCTLQNHKLKETKSPKVDQFRCDKCGKKFLSNHDLQRHKVVHSEKPLHEAFL